MYKLLIKPDQNPQDSLCIGVHRTGVKLGAGAEVRPGDMITLRNFRAGKWAKGSTTWHITEIVQPNGMFMNRRRPEGLIIYKSDISNSKNSSSIDWWNAKVPGEGLGMTFVLIENEELENG